MNGIIRDGVAQLAILGVIFGSLSLALVLGYSAFVWARDGWDAMVAEWRENDACERIARETRLAAQGPQVLGTWAGPERPTRERFTQSEIGVRAAERRR